jgi:hypothetical protein
MTITCFERINLINESLKFCACHIRLRNYYSIPTVVKQQFRLWSILLFIHGFNCHTRIVRFPWLQNVNLHAPMVTVQVLSLNIRHSVNGWSYEIKNYGFEVIFICGREDYMWDKKHTYRILVGKPIKNCHSEYWKWQRRIALAWN